MKVLLTGGSGFVGREILRQLHSEGHVIRLLSRDCASAQRLQQKLNLPFEFRQGDVLEAASLAGTMTGVEAVIHLVGIIREFRENRFERVHTGGTRNLVDAAQQAGVARFVHMSALGTRPAAKSRYHQSKWAAEEIVRGSGLQWTILRPSIIYGPEDEFVNLFARMAGFSPILPVMGDGCAKLQPIAVPLVARCFVGALTQPASIRKEFELCGPQALSFNDVLKTILQVLGKRRALIHLPMRLARIQACLMEWVFPLLLRQPSPLNRDQLLMLQEDNTGNPDDSTKLFGLKPTSFKEGISAYLHGPSKARN